MPLESQYQYYKMALEVAKQCPEGEDKITEHVVEKLCLMDVDLKQKTRRFQFSS